MIFCTLGGNLTPLVMFERRDQGIPAEMGSEVKILKVGGPKRIVLFQFYKKPMANPCPNLMR